MPVFFSVSVVILLEADTEVDRMESDAPPNIFYESAAVDFCRLVHNSGIFNEIQKSIYIFRID